MATNYYNQGYQRPQSRGSIYSSGSIAPQRQQYVTKRGSEMNEEGRNPESFDSVISESSYTPGSGSDGDVTNKPQIHESLPSTSAYSGGPQEDPVSPDEQTPEHPDQPAQATQPVTTVAGEIAPTIAPPTSLKLIPKIHMIEQYPDTEEGKALWEKENPGKPFPDIPQYRLKDAYRVSGEYPAMQDYINQVYNGQTDPYETGEVGYGNLFSQAEQELKGLSKSAYSPELGAEAQRLVDQNQRLGQERGDIANIRARGAALQQLSDRASMGGIGTGSMARAGARAQDAALLARQRAGFETDIADMGIRAADEARKLQWQMQLPSMYNVQDRYQTGIDKFNVGLETDATKSAWLANLQDDRERKHQLLGDKALTNKIQFEADQANRQRAMELVERKNFEDAPWNKQAADLFLDRGGDPDVLMEMYTQAYNEGKPLDQVINERFGNKATEPEPEVAQDGIIKQELPEEIVKQNKINKIAVGAGEQLPVPEGIKQSFLSASKYF